MTTFSKAFSLGEAKGCMTTYAVQDSICGYLYGDYICRELGYICLYNNKPICLRVKEKSVTLGHLFTMNR
ncbi:hypothetical protein BRARA_J01657 [Brassica rapa]|uniref:Uncharacterized protein n=1 Tax=Brassica campestris TaxID=3711 RepID=A0A397XL33_BRACM|nr:hypothetical protein BRARA_J01657 [Brassica rapa]